MMRFALAVALVGSPVGVGLAGPLPSYSGLAASYSKGVMERVAVVRGMEPAACMAASFRLPLGRWLVVRGQRTGVQRICKVMDICAPKDCKRILRRGIRVELDFVSNRAICGSSREPPSFCPVTITEVSR